jgi:hypothetical protein
VCPTYLLSTALVPSTGVHMTEEGEESLEVSRGGDELETSNTSDDSQVISI